MTKKIKRIPKLFLTLILSLFIVSTSHIKKEMFKDVDLFNWPFTM